jgi:hypothetical protein
MLLIVGSEYVDLSSFAADGPYEIRRCERAEEFAAVRDARFDAAVFCAFPESLPEPKILLAEIARNMNAGARVVAHVPPLVRAAVRIAVFKGSVGEYIAPVVTDDDVALYGVRSLATLFEEAGFRLAPFGPSASILEGVLDAAAAAGGVAGDAAIAPPDGALFPEPSVDERLAYAERELAELRAFFATIHDNQRRLHEEAARLRAMLGAREVELDALRLETWELRRKTTAVVEDGSSLVRALEADVARSRATIADLEARNVRLREALAELRDRAPV